MSRTRLNEANDNLVTAVREGKWYSIPSCLEKDADINYTTKSGKTLLMMAAKNGHTYTVQELLKLGADVLCTTKKGNSALTLAARKGHVDTALLLLELGADTDDIHPNDLDDGLCEFRNALMKKAVQKESKYIVRILLVIPDVDCEAALIMAVDDGNLPMIDLLLDEGIGIHLITREALTRVATNGRYDVVSSLLCAGVDPNYLGEFFYPVLRDAVQNYGIEVLLKLLEANPDSIYSRDDAGYTLLMHAVQNGCLSAVNELLKVAPNIIHDMDNERNTALKIAKSLENNPISIHITFALLEAGANPRDLTESEMGTTLINAAKKGKKDVIQILLEVGLDLNQDDEFGYNALTYAAQNGHLVVVEMLLEADVNPDYNEFAPMREAVTNERTGVVTALLKADANPNCTIKFGNTPLMQYAKKGDSAMVKMLLEAGANPNDVNKFGYNALSCAPRGTLGDEVRSILLEVSDDPIPIIELSLPAFSDTKSDPESDSEEELGEFIDELWRKTVLGYIEERLLEVSDHRPSSTLPDFSDSEEEYRAEQLGIGKRAQTIDLLSGDINLMRQQLLTQAAENGWHDTVSLCLNEGADPHDLSRSQFGATLIKAAKNGQNDVMQILLDAGADLNHSDEFGSLLAYAAQSGNSAVVQMLLAAGYHPDNDLITALKISLENDYNGIVGMLLEKAAGPDYVDQSGDNALMRCALSEVSNHRPSSFSYIDDPEEKHLTVESSGESSEESDCD